MTTFATHIRLGLCSATAALGLLTGCGSDSSSSPPSSAVAPAPASAPTVTGPATTPVAVTEPPETEPPETWPPETVGTAPDDGVAAQLPPVKVEPGTYRVTEFVVPYEITVSGTWTRYASTDAITWIGRGANATSELVIMKGLFSPLEAFAATCPGTNWGPASEVEVFGQPGVEHDGTTAVDCVIGEVRPGTTLSIPAGHTLHVAAAEVSGQVVVVIADGAAEDWPALASDVAAMQASLRPAT